MFTYLSVAHKFPGIRWSIRIICLSDPPAPANFQIVDPRSGPRDADGGWASWGLVGLGFFSENDCETEKPIGEQWVLHGFTVSDCDCEILDIGPTEHTWNPLQPRI